MEKEFNLSKKYSEYYNGFQLKDVKEFIRLLKDANNSNFLYGKFSPIMNKIIDKLAGDKLK